MTYRVVVVDEVFDRLREFSHYIAVHQQAPKNASEWINRVLLEIDSLGKMPNRYPLAPKSQPTALTLRVLRVDRCLLIYQVDEETKTVVVVEFRHGSEQA